MNNKTIIIDGKPFTYEEEKITYEGLQALTREDAVHLLKTTKELLYSKQIPFYLCFGTLLGAIRNHDLIPGDEDIDVFVTDESKLRSILPYLYENGLRVVRITSSKVYSFRLNGGAYIDIYIQHPITGFSIWRPFCYSLANNGYTPKNLLKEFIEIEFLEGRYLVPKEYETLLELWYGKTWRVPVRGHNMFYYEVKSHWYWVKIIIPTTVIVLGTIVGYPYWRPMLRKNVSKEAFLKDWKQYKNTCKKAWNMILK